MCDEYDDERMRIFWRTLAERAALPQGDEERGAEGKAPFEPIVVPVDAGSKAKSRPLLR